MGLPIGKQIDEFGGFTLSVDQHWWGHRARKRTLLYICGCKKNELPAIPLRFEPVTHVVSSSRGKRHMPCITRKEREATPIQFANWLIEVALKCNHSTSYNY